MTAALPADLTERVLEVIADQRGSDRSIIFISHRLIEIAAVCDRATVLREGETVGVVDVTEGSENHIVALMLGEERVARERADAAPASSAGGCRGVGDTAAGRPRPPRRDTTDRMSRSSFAPARCSASSPSRGRARTSSSTSWPAPTGPRGGDVLVDGTPVIVPPSRRCHPGRARLRARRSRRGVADAAVRPREHRAAVHRVACGRGARSTSRLEQRRVAGATEQLQIDTRAAAEVRRLSGGNQQKVTIARWVAGGVRTLLCFDPTRGIDIGTKHQIYQLLRDLAAGGAAVLLYTSELKEIQLACDRAIVIFGGRVVAEIADRGRRRADAPPCRLRPAARRPDARGGRGDGDRRAKKPGRRGRRHRRPGRAQMTAAAAAEPAARPRQTDALRWARRNSWTLGLVGLLAAFLAITILIQPTYGAADIQGLAIGALPLAMAAVAQAIVVISGGIDLSVGPMMALTSVTAAVLMQGQSEVTAVGVVVGVIALGLLIGAINGVARRHHPRARHRRHPRHVVRVGGGHAARPQHARRRLRGVAEGLDDGFDRQ